MIKVFLILEKNPHISGGSFSSRYTLKEFIVKDVPLNAIRGERLIRTTRTAPMTVSPLRFPQVSHIAGTLRFYAASLTGALKIEIDLPFMA